MSHHAVVWQIDLVLMQSHVTSLPLDPQVDDSPEKNLWYRS